MTESEFEQGPRVRDQRRFDPQTGTVREPAAEPAPGANGAAGAAGDGTLPDEVLDASDVVDGSADPDGLAGAQQALAERTADLQRLQAEFTNYRRRVERDRVAVRDEASASLAAGLLPVLDDIGRARQHGALEGGFKAVAEAVEQVTAKLGVESYAAPGDPFDPTVHEALVHVLRPDVDGPTCVEVYQPGYRLGGRVLRPARVVVADHGDDDTAAPVTDPAA